MFTVVTDSTAYFTRAEAQALGIRVVPMSYSVSGQMFLEDYIGENGDYIRLIETSGYSTHTSQAGVGAFLSVFSELRRRGENIFCLTISSRLSGTFASAMSAARELDAAGTSIMVADSLSTGGGLRMLVERASAMSKEGFSLERTADEIERLRDKVGIAFSVENMTPLRKSGRLGLVGQSVSTILNVRPILLCQKGTIVSGGVVRGTRAQIEALVNAVPSNSESVILHYIRETQSVDALHKATEALADRGMAVETCPIGPVLGIHLGMDVLGLAWMTKA